jgi:hypothetical protein
MICFFKTSGLSIGKGRPKDELSLKFDVLKDVEREGRVRV